MALIDCGKAGYRVHIAWPITGSIVQVCLWICRPVSSAWFCLNLIVLIYITNQIIVFTLMTLSYVKHTVIQSTLPYIY
jgi:hypothetical protein